MRQLPYPNLDAQSPARVLPVLGGFWSDVYDGRDLVEHILRVRGELSEDSYAILDDAQLVIGREDCPVLRIERWRALNLPVEDKVLVPYRFGDPDLQFDGEIVYGEGTAYAWPCGEDLVTATATADRINTPAVLWVHGIDFDFRRIDGVRHIVFQADPTAQGTFLLRDNDDGQDITVWVYQAQIDRLTFYRHWGFVLGRSGPSTEPYKRVVNLALDALTGGTSTAILEELFSAATGVPLATANETVEKVTTHNGRLWVITDRTAYDLSDEASPLVAVGDTLVPGQELCDGLIIDDLNRGIVPDGVVEITIPPTWLLGVTAGPLSFSNEEVEWSYEETPDGLKASFEIGGNPLDVEAFWAAVHERGAASGEMLVDYLDERPEGQDDPPDVNSLPATVVPLEFAIEHLLRHNTLLVRIDATQADPPGRVLDDALLRRVMPPGATVLCITTLGVNEESVGPGSESIDIFSAMDPIDERVGPGTEYTYLRLFSVRYR